MNKFKLMLLAFIIFSASPAMTRLYAQNMETNVKVKGEVVTPLNLNSANLQGFTQAEVKRKDHDGKEHVYTGVLLSEVLQKAGAPLGKDLRGKNLGKYALVKASDGYRVVFSLGELDKDFTDRIIILASQVDGKPLGPAEGPFRIIVQNEKKPARCVRMVTEIEIQSAK
ncbi:molybdopterin-dependent oxidoreductase [Mucilaginibacter sp. L3T2-6]|uniref:molybdopterin-dependent oxidoreductase n=1 Tax=Mucilaginibacter sp. L3T2-6 TaxID=3062491 RepID=UPI0026768802|nr:molybdopterin-dependent oxidoreductase [Mucilaginibacter sp. L3T2-6]MDO3644012.1 molybdopterin-dependent oxidoreductase [Mucilaginibacter sp. L3T2-6]MDV6216463.1 molybdopterin-dependent oxidoreductase [Mucilaginibacter sp. L3T2-6]